jgi:Spy/CpxP family protein refolding chaperone
MKLNMGTRTQAIALLLLVATSGALAGVVGDRLLLERDASRQPGEWRPSGVAGPPPDGPWRWEARPDERYAQRLAHSLELSEAQRVRIESIVELQQERVRELAEEMQPRFRAISEEARAGIEDVLTAEQRQRLESLRQERMRLMRPGMREMMRQGDGHGPPAGMRNGGPGRMMSPAMRDSAMRGPGMRGSRDSIP